MNVFIDIIEVQSGTKLYQFSIDQEKEAYSQALKLEEMGLSVKLIFPSPTISLGKSLGFEEKELSCLKSEIEDEIKNHSK